MVFQKIVLPADEDIVRLIARPPSSAGKTPKIRAADFDRRMDIMSGISMFRVAAKNIARNNWQSTWLKGILIAKAGPLQALGLDFYDTGNDHFSVRCTGCDLSQNQYNQRPLCSKGSDLCDFDPAQIQTMRQGQVIAQGIRDLLVPLFTVDTNPY
jgi:hypothetical protein